MRVALSSLDGRAFDVAVIGAGINGASAAQQLAAAGYDVLLVDKADFASGSSGRSSRLLHCGLRYLAPGGSMWDFLRHPARLGTALRMSRQAMIARGEFVRDARERTRTITFGFPIWRGGPYSAWQIDLAFRVLAALGPSEPPLDYKRLAPAEVARVPLFNLLRDRGRLVGVAAFREYQFDWPERVTLDMALDAERMGAVARNYTPVVGLERAGAGWRLTLADAAGGGAKATVEAMRASVEARIVLNTAGIWIDRVNALARTPVGRKITGTKGAHIVLRLPPECEGHGIITMNRKGVEPVYLFPWRQGLHYFGVTETLYDGDIDDVRADESDIDWLIAEFNHLLPDLAITRADVLYTWAGVRPLTHDPALPKGARSRLVHDLSPEGMPGVFALTAGPVTTHRSAGVELSQRVRALIRPSRPPRAPDHRPREFPPSPGSPFVLNDYPSVTFADLRHAAAHEHPLTLVDLLFRRVGLGWCESQAREGARAAAEAVADVLGWDDARTTREVEAYHAHLAHAHRLGTGG